MEANNMKAMREALEKIAAAYSNGSCAFPNFRGDGTRGCKYDGCLGAHTCTECEHTVRNIARAALAAPARNCDRPECQATPEAARVWKLEDGGKTAYHEWLLAPATERKGETDGSK